MGLLIPVKDNAYENNNCDYNYNSSGYPTPPPLPRPTRLPVVVLTTTTAAAGLDFEQYLKSQNKRNTRQILSYARRYAHNTDKLLQLSPNKRRHAMEALTAYSKYIGKYEQWQQIRRQYSLKWSNGDESLQALQRFFDSNLTLDSMLSKVKEMIRVLPAHMAAVVRFAVLTGLRPSEACESVRLLLSNGQYYNSEQQCLEHFRFSEFIRPTKKAYLSYLSRANYDAIVSLGPKTPTWNAIRSACKRRNIEMSMHLCRKIFASYLRQNGIEPEVIDLLQGRVSQSVLTKHYLAPDNRLRERVLDVVEELQQQIENL